MSNLRNAPLFLTPQVTRDLLGEGHARNMARIEVVSLTQCGNRCSALRLSILRVIDRFERGGMTLMMVASELRLSNAALDEHIRALRQCGCVTPFRLALTPKGVSKIARTPAKQTKKQTNKPAPKIAAADMPTSLQSRDGDFPPVAAVPATHQAASKADSRQPEGPSNPGSACRDEVPARVAAPVPANSKTAGTGEMPKFKSWVEDYVKPEERFDPELVRAAMRRRGKVVLTGQSPGTKGYYTTLVNIANAAAREKHRREDPFEQAKSFLQKRGPVFSATFRDGPKGEWFVAGQRGFLTNKQVIELAKRKGWTG